MKSSPLFQAIVGADRGRAPVVARRQALLASWSKDPMRWLCGVDSTTTDPLPEDPLGRKWPDGRPLIWTSDERDNAEPVKPFPVNKGYLWRLVEELMSNRVVLLDKARQMYVSTTIMLLLDWIGKFQPARQLFVSKHKEQEAVQLVRLKIRNVHRRLPGWVQDALPISDSPQDRIDYPGTGSELHAVVQNVAQSEARGGTASVFFVDEAPLQEEFGDIMAAALPMAARIWAVGTAQVGNRGAEVFRRYIEEGREVRK